MAVFSLTSWVKRTFGFAEGNTYMNGGPSYAGKDVTFSSAMALSTVYACVRLISRSIASLPCGVFEKDALGDSIKSRDSDLYTLLHDRPNADMTAFDFWQAVIACVLLWGNAYVKKTYRGTGSARVLISIEPLFPGLMTLQLNDNGSTTFVYTADGKRVEYSEDQIAHFKGFGVSGRLGLSVLSLARQSFGNAMAQEETSGRFYSNGMRPGSALKMSNTLKADQRKDIRENIVEQMEGVAKSGGTLILEGGMEYQALAIPPADAQMLESRAFSVEEICRWFGVPPSMIGHSGSATMWGTGVEQIQLAFLQFCLTPTAKSVEQEINRSIIPVTKRGTIFAEFNLEGFMRADSTGRAALYNSASQNGWMTRKEIRQKENLPFIPGSDKLTVQSALVNLEDLGKTDTSKTIEDSGKV